MNEALYMEKLNWFKHNEKPEVVLMIANNPEFIRIIIAWSNLEVRTADELTMLAGDSENEIWGWLWQNCRFSLAELKVKLVFRILSLSWNRK